MLDRFLRHAAAVRARKAFDAEERNLRVRPLARLRRLIARSRDGEGWRQDFDRLFHARMNGLAGLPMPLLLPRHAAWASDWAEGDAASLRAALAGAASSDANAEERFAAFASAAARAGRGGDEGSLIAVGSLLNFAREPRSLPVVRARPLNRLETMFEQPAQPGLDVPELYAHHLRFVRELADRMREAGIDVRDMIDAEALIEVSLAEADLWAPGSEDAERRRLEAAGRRAPAYLSLCAVYRDDAPYLLEWIEFHRLVGVERFFLYNNGDRDDQRELLAPYVEEGTRDPARVAEVVPRPTRRVRRLSRATSRRRALDRVHRHRRVPVLAHRHGRCRKCWRTTRSCPRVGVGPRPVRAPPAMRTKPDGLVIGELPSHVGLQCPDQLHQDDRRPDASRSVPSTRHSLLPR